MDNRRSQAGVCEPAFASPRPRTDARADAASVTKTRPRTDHEPPLASLPPFLTPFGSPLALHRRGPARVAFVLKKDTLVWAAELSTWMKAAKAVFR